MFGAVGLPFVVVVMVAGGERQTGSDVGAQRAFQGTESAHLPDLERVLGLRSAQAER